MRPSYALNSKLCIFHLQEIFMLPHFAFCVFLQYYLTANLTSISVHFREEVLCTCKMSDSFQLFQSIYGTRASPYCLCL